MIANLAARKQVLEAPNKTPQQRERDLEKVEALIERREVQVEDTRIMITLGDD